TALFVRQKRRSSELLRGKGQSHRKAGIQLHSSDDAGRILELHSDGSWKRTIRTVSSPEWLVSAHAGDGSVRKSPRNRGNLCYCAPSRGLLATRPGFRPR